MKKTKPVAAAAPTPKTKIAEAIEILAALGLPQAQRNDRSALALLALADIRPDSNWEDAKPNLLRIHDILRFAHDAYGKSYAENSRETFRRQTIHQFEKGSLVERNPDDPERPTNSGKTVYRLTEDARLVLALYGDASFAAQVQAFLASHGSLQEAYARRREMNLVPVKLTDGSTVRLSPGAHNRLQKAVIEEFAPRFAPHAVLLYLGDTAQKHVICDVKGLAAIGITLTEHDKLPDILLYREPERCLFLIEAVTSHGPVSLKRLSRFSLPN